MPSLTVIATTVMNNGHMELEKGHLQIISNSNNYFVSVNENIHKL